MSEVLTKPKIKSGTVTRKCKCDHDYQDSQYGINQRIHNRCALGKIRCTVCSSEKLFK